MTAPAHVARLAATVEVDEAADTVRWRDADGRPCTAGLHDYGALYAVPGLYEAVYMTALGGQAPRLLVDLLSACVPVEDRARRRVLDVGAGTGVVGELLVAAGFAQVWGTDLEPAAERAVRRDRPGRYRDVRTLDLADLTDADLRWLRRVAPDVVTVVGAVGFGHLPAEALAVLTRVLPPGSLLALTVAPELDSSPALAGHAAVLRGPQWREVARRDGLHRTTADGQPVPARALVLSRTEVAA